MSKGFELNERSHKSSMGELNETVHAWNGSKGIINLPNTFRMSFDSWFLLLHNSTAAVNWWDAHITGCRYRRWTGAIVARWQAGGTISNIVDGVCGGGAIATDDANIRNLSIWMENVCAQCQCRLLIVAILLFLLFGRLLVHVTHNVGHCGRLPVQIFFQMSTTAFAAARFENQIVSFFRP